LPPSVNRLSRQFGILNISQPYRPQSPVTGIALLFYHATANNCNTIAVLHSLEITVAYTKSLQSIFSSCYMVMFLCTVSQLIHYRNSLLQPSGLLAMTVHQLAVRSLSCLVIGSQRTLFLAVSLIVVVAIA
jgi:hypothetical protein